MTDIVVNAEMATKIRAAGPDIVLIAEDGTVVCRMNFEPAKSDGLWYTPEQRARRMSGTGRPVADILRDLRDLRVKYGD